ncbi:MAG TPA: hypothetical protein VNA87_03540 [Actinomycetota bacterium]|nr:hypothetical protein [Actinomycetota bacterium]
MRKLPRKTLKRLWYCGLLILWILPFTLAAIASADGALVTAESTGQGWYWKGRPQYFLPVTEPAPTQAPGTSVGGDVYCYNAPANPCATQWKQEHIYVGWDGQALTAEMIGAVNFDLEPIPSGSTITRFAFTIKQHPSGDGHNHTPNYDAPAKHGIVACPWPEFFGGEHAAWLDPESKKQRLCGDAVSGASSNVDAAFLGDPRNTVEWTFDLSSIASEWAAGTNPAISIEPDSRLKSPVSWITSFHQDTILHDPTSTHVTHPPPNATSPGAKAGDIPGLYAQVTYLLPTGEEEIGSVSGEFSTEFDTSGDSLAFGDTEGLVGDLGGSAEPSEPVDATPSRQLTAGVFEGNPAGFWAYPLAWIAAVAGFILLGFAGKVLQAEPGQGRPLGAAAALMRGSSRTS